MSDDSIISEGAKAAKKGLPGLDKQDWAAAASALHDRIDAIQAQMKQGAGVARDWALKQADAAKTVTAEKPVLVVSASAGAALALGLLAGFVLGRATADD